jgi:molybdopterin-guanine dinucleotide biosynthesis protein A
MGQDKVLLPWEGGQIIDRMIQIARQFAPPSEVFLIGERPHYHGRGAIVVADRYPDRGPLGGIATALSVTKLARVLVLGGDMPLVSERLLQAMVALDTRAEVVVPVRDDAGSAQRGDMTFETLHAIYRVSCLKAIERRMERAELSVIGMFDDVTVEPLDEAWLRMWDPTLRSFANANTPEDLERMRANRTLEC